jgi:hypothetical protein
MRGGLTATLQAALVIAAICLLPSASAFARSCTCNCEPAWPHGSEYLTIDLNERIPCSAGNGRSCTVANTNPKDAASRAGGRVSGTTRSCSGSEGLFDTRR